MGQLGLPGPDCRCRGTFARTAVLSSLSIYNCRATDELAGDSRLLAPALTSRIPVPPSFGRCTGGAPSPVAALQRRRYKGATLGIRLPHSQAGASARSAMIVKEAACCAPSFGPMPRWRPLSSAPRKAPAPLSCHQALMRYKPSGAIHVTGAAASARRSCWATSALMTLSSARSGPSFCAARALASSG